ncbi:MAG: PTS IIA-like nitrogen regulatory protein PtsN [Arsenophonus sp.]|nr:MAG: PTS IIA-like nitrogen regulatory protein PtsN [Arsenophonus sp.]
MKNEEKISLKSLLTKSCTLNNVHCKSKKRALEIVSEVSANVLNIPINIVFNALLTREKVGNTVIGRGIAIPHGKIYNSNSSKVIGVLIHLNQTIIFDEIDNQLVDLLFALLIPSESCNKYLDIIALITKKFTNKNLCRRLRSAKSNEELYKFIIE